MSEEPASPCDQSIPIPDNPTWLWGAWGTILAVSMLVVVKSICDHVRSLAPVGRLLAR